MKTEFEAKKAETEFILANINDTGFLYYKDYNNNAYEILEYDGFEDLKEYKAYYGFKKVKRLSDGEMFCKGDVVDVALLNYAQIISFSLVGNILYVCGEFIPNIKINVPLSDIKKVAVAQPQPILTTEEGDKKYMGDKVWWVGDGGNHNMGEWVIDIDSKADFLLYFSTEIAAKGYQLLARLKSLHEQGLKYINEYNQ